ncbi:MAG: hypothetical protein IJU53_03860 [Thermoguttaceae bacterium]|nr:hypothetical protein [Thermoguttaceae bacterium]
MDRRKRLTEAAREEYIRLDTILAILTSGAGTAETAAAINAGKIVLTDTRTDAEQASNAPPHWTLKTA